MQIDNPDFIAWHHFNRLIMSWIYAFLTEVMLYQIVGYSTALEIWNALNQIYFAASMAREPVSYIDHLLYLFGGLDRAYNLFVTLIINRPDKPSIEEIHSLLLSYEFRLDSQNSDDQLSYLQANLSQLNLIKNLSNLILPTLDMTPNPPMFNMMSSNIATTNSVADNSRIRTHTISSSRDTLIVASTKYVHHHLHQDILSYLLALKPSSFKPKISTSGIGV
ncbi:hypothetical protein CK203_083983 [Vitis vinifera]|uniref:Retrovirus-related Pol polyprotein from transposon RE1 n=1 Tax=Vitis vinifera TaxID=29760 RepID=A0A438EUV1_VITVI|nr:hypothetical protein CK203_083983 [Vitis vinifera]